MVKVISRCKTNTHNLGINNIVQINNTELIRDFLSQIVVEQGYNELSEGCELVGICFKTIKIF